MQILISILVFALASWCPVIAGATFPICFILLAILSIAGILASAAGLIRNLCGARSLV